MSKKQNSCSNNTSIGGQALIEGILMRGPEKQAVVCRTADGLVERCENIRPLKEKYKLGGVPIIRGAIALYDSMVNGTKALTYSAELIPLEEQEQPSKFELWLEKRVGSKKMEKFAIGLALFLGLGLAIFLFTIIPTFTAGLLPFAKGNVIFRSAIEGVLKLIIFLSYIWLCTQIKDVKRLFAYHGAEHKSIFCYEKGLPLTVENVMAQSRFHPRCGTSLLLVAIILGIILGFLIRTDSTLLRVFLRLLLLPILVGIAYELNRWIGMHGGSIVERILSAPGKWVQHLTTKEPDEGMAECAIRALELVIPENKDASA